MSFRRIAPWVVLALAIQAASAVALSLLFGIHYL